MVSCFDWEFFSLLQIIMFYNSYCLCFGLLICVMVGGLSLARIAGSNPTGVWSVVNMLCCQAEVSAMGRSLVQRSTTQCGVSEFDRGTSQRRLNHTRSCATMRKCTIQLGL